MRALALGLVTVAMAGCAQEGSQSSSDCAAQVRVAGVVYTSYGTTSREATRYVEADEAQCHDVGTDARGSVFADNPAQVRTWAFEGYSPKEVLGVQYGKHELGVFIADTVAPEERDSIYANLAENES